MKIVWSPLALDRVSEHADFLSAENPAAAERWIDLVFNAIARLADFPLSGRLVSELKRSDVREILCSSFRIIYRIDAAQVTILTLRHTRQAPDAEEFAEL